MQSFYWSIVACFKLRDKAFFRNEGFWCTLMYINYACCYSNAQLHIVQLLQYCAVVTITVKWISLLIMGLQVEVYALLTMMSLSFVRVFFGIHNLIFFCFSKPVKLHLTPSAVDPFAVHINHNYLFPRTLSLLFFSRLKTVLFSRSWVGNASK